MLRVFVKEPYAVAGPGIAGTQLPYLVTMAQRLSGNDQDLGLGGIRITIWIKITIGKLCASVSP